MKYMNNFHTHTVFCDGKNTPEEYVLAAIDIGMPILGFSAHSHLPTEPEWSLSVEGEEEYRKTILELREKYKNQIDIRLGIEQDFWSSTEGLSDYDFVIGSVHSLNGDDTTWSSVDYKKENFLYGVEHYFGGDREAAAVRYFELVSQVYDKTKCDIIGHFDLITIFNDMTLEETGEMFVNTDDPRVVEAERKALEKLAAAPVIFEINTGGVNRGRMKHPYPSDRVMAFLSEHKIPVILSSDAHETRHLTAGFDEAMKLVEKFDLNLVYDYKTVENRQEVSE
ncbi:MAG: histidinol-phosphatase [Clostridia bacterium]|nr:histidinol-phosphatase [Clostridia bacterium]